MNTDASDQKITVLFMEKVLTTVRQFVRDWSNEGMEERKMCYKPIVDEITNLYPADKYKPSDVSILVPGAGLARLMVDLARFGYTIQGNEWSLFMLIASNYILNKCSGAYHTTIYPFVHQSCNNMSSEDQLRPVQIPDINPTTLPANIDFSMNAGNFTEIYDETNQWDCVATCFFIDTANNIVSYIETIYKILKPGGYWINLGPLLYHFADVPNESSIEISYKELRNLIINEFKFELLKEESLKSTYIGNKKSMLQTIYNCIFFVVRKPL
jgi:carnosine N-methyltransferase